MLEAAVIAIPHPKWDERPLLIVVPHPAGPPPTPEDVLTFMQVGVPQVWCVLLVCMLLSDIFSLCGGRLLVRAWKIFESIYWRVPICIILSRHVPGKIYHCAAQCHHACLGTSQNSQDVPLPPRKFCCGGMGSAMTRAIEFWLNFQYLRDMRMRSVQGKVAKWWLPDDCVLVEEIPHTATGKISKLELRKQFKDFRPQRARL